MDQILYVYAALIIFISYLPILIVYWLLPYNE